MGDEEGEVGDAASRRVPLWVSTSERVNVDSLGVAKLAPAGEEAVVLGEEVDLSLLSALQLFAEGGVDVVHGGLLDG